jgi:hypothetical protein
MDTVAIMACLDAGGWAGVFARIEAAAASGRARP